MPDHPQGPQGPPALYRAHQVLIVSAIVLGVLLGAWGLWSHGRGGGDVALVVGAASLVVAVLLGLYLRRFRRRLGPGPR